jgi:glycosyltransferase involved in cell wall biosynthesis
MQLRVLHVTPYYEPAFIYGGPTRSVPELCKALVRTGVEVTVLSTNANGSTALDVPLAQPTYRSGVEVLYYPRRDPLRTFRSPEMASNLRNMVRRYDLVHIMGAWSYPASQGATTAHRHHVPYVISPRGMLMPWEFQYKAWKKWPYFYLRGRGHLLRSAGIHCTSESERDALKRWGVDRQAFIVPNGIDLAEFQALPARGTLRNRLGIAAESKVMLFLGRLHLKKGIELLLDSFSQLACRNEQVHLLLVGPDEGGYSTSIPEWAVDHGLAARVHTLGELKGVDRLAAYADADLFVLLSQSENFAMSVAEAMACGVAVVVTPGVGLSPAVQRWNSGIVVSYEPEAVATDLESLLLNNDRLQDMGRNGKKLAEAEYSADVVGMSMARQYERIVKSGRTGAAG